MRSEPWSSNYGQLKTAAYECWKPNSGSLEEQNLFLAMELSPAPRMIFTFFFCFSIPLYLAVVLFPSSQLHLTCLSQGSLNLDDYVLFHLD